MQVVYIDVLFIINLILNYFILLGTAAFLHRDDKRLRLLLGAAVGALYASLMFFPEIGFLYTAALKIAFSATIVAISYKWSGIKNFFKIFLTFYVISMLFGGIIYALQLFLAPPGLDVRNGVMYMDISPLVLILSGAGCYILIKLFSKYFHRNVHTADLYVIEIEVEGKRVKMTALLDNGNSLRDTISGYPVVIAEYRRVEPLIPVKLRLFFRSGRVGDTQIFDSAEEWRRRVRMIPYGSVGSVGGTLPAFRPDRFIIAAEGISTTEVLVAVTNNRLSEDGTFFALLNPHLFHANETDSVPILTR